MKRRGFLQSGLAITAATVPPSFVSNPRFSIKFMATDWGFTGTIEEFCKAAKKEGYDGVEVWWPREEEAKKRLFSSLHKENLQVGFLCAGWQSEPIEHIRTFKSSVLAATSDLPIKPLYINCHSGRDYFSFDENLSMIRFTIERSKQTGIPIYHETHRGRMCFAAPVTRKFLEAERDMHLTLDISHWCNVHESLLEDQVNNVDIAIERTEHIHARVGHPEGPQVNDPRAPEWNKELKQHLAWWDKVVKRKKGKGEMLTILTEFGPANYMPTLPYTRQPVADQWEINAYMMRLLRERYL